MALGRPYGGEYECPIHWDIVKDTRKFGQVYVDGKFKEVIEYVQGNINRVEAEVRKNKDEQNAINMEQAVYNGTNTAAVACLKGQVAQLQALTEIVVPQRRVCDTGCCCNNQ
jgi:hypothetical protein